MRYKTLLFDADGTVLDFHRSEREALSETLISVGIVPDEEKMNAYSVINDGLWKMLERKEIEKSVLLYRRFELFCEKFGYDRDARKMARDYMNALSTKGYVLDGAEELIKSLYGKARMYIVTNGVEFIQRGRYARCGIDKYFDGVFISDVIGVEKPDRRYFEYVASNIPEFDPEDTIVIGDSLSSDIRGGNNFGLDTCWYNPQGKSANGIAQPTYIAADFDEVARIIMGE